MPSLLWVTAEVPDRHGGGGNIRQHHLLHRLAERFDVDLVVAGRLPDDDAGLRRRLRRVVEVEKAPPFRFPRNRLLHRLALLRIAMHRRRPFEVVEEEATRRRLAAALPADRRRSHDVVVLVHAALAPLLDARDAAVWVLELQNVGSERSGHLAAVAEHPRHRWMWRADARRAERLERWAADRADVVVVCADGDGERVGGTTLVVPNGVDVGRFRPSPLPAEPRIVLTATFSYAANVDGAAWFVERVFPLVRAAVPAATLELVGRDPVPEVRELARRDGVSASFDVPSVVPHLEAARVAVVPLRVGSGTRLKALEAMAAGRPVAGTAIGLAGIGVADGDTAAVADDEAALAARIVRLLDDDEHAAGLAERGRKLAEGFGWDAIAARYAGELQRICGG